MAVKTLKVDLPAEIFDAQASVPLLHQVVIAQLAAARQGTHKTKNRGEVSGAGRKPFKQKGTGNTSGLHPCTAHDRRWRCSRSDPA